MTGATWKRKRKWSEMSGAEKLLAVVMAGAQLTMAILAWRDLAQRPREGVKGPKWRWAMVIGANFFGPIAYYRRGRIEA